jgi:hypothetical protein
MFPPVIICISIADTDSLAILDEPMIYVLCSPERCSLLIAVGVRRKISAFWWLVVKLG